MSAILNQLNWRNDTRFIQLSGIFPVDPAVLLHDKVVNFSAAAVPHQVRQRVPNWAVAYHSLRKQDVVYFRRDVTRGLTSDQIVGYDEWIEGVARPYGPFER